MPTLVTEQGIIHYETWGRGRPVLLLHGWLNSWAVWRNSMNVLGREFKIYALDFFGFGESGDQANDFSVDNFVTLVDQFMDRMGIIRAPLVGHSMGGTVSLSAALRFPEKIVKVIVVGSPIVGESLSPLLKLAAWKGWTGLAESAPFLFKPVQSGLQPLLKSYGYIISRGDGKMVGEMLAHDLGKLNAAPFLESIGTLRNTDLRTRLNTVQIPVLGIYGKRDVIVNPNQSRVLRESLPTSKIDWFENSGHFPMIDEADRFHDSVRNFLANG